MFSVMLSGEGHHSDEDGDSRRLFWMQSRNCFEEALRLDSALGLEDEYGGCEGLPRDRRLLTPETNRGGADVVVVRRVGPRC